MVDRLCLKSLPYQLRFESRVGPFLVARGRGWMGVTVFGEPGCVGVSPGAFLSALGHFFRLCRIVLLCPWRSHGCVKI